MSFFSEQLQKSQPGIAGIVGYLNQVKQQRQNQAMYERLRPIIEKMSQPTQVQQTVPGATLPNMANVVPGPQTPGLPQAQGQQPQALQTPDRTITQSIPAANDYAGYMDALMAGGVPATQGLGDVLGLRQQDITNQQKEMQQRLLQQERESTDWYRRASLDSENWYREGMLNKGKQNGDKMVRSYPGDDNKMHLIWQKPDGSTYETAGDSPLQPKAAAAGGAMAPENIMELAKWTHDTGHFPPLGFSASGLRTQFLNALAEYTKSHGPMSVSQADFKSVGTALTQQTKLYASQKGWGGNINRNIQAALNMSANLRRTTSTAINKMQQGWQRNAQTVPGLTGFEVLVYAIARDYAKVSTGATGGAQLSDAATAAATSLLNTAQSQGNFQAAVQQIQTELNNQLQSTQSSIDFLRSQIGSGQNNGTQAEAQPQQQGQSATGTTQFNVGGKVYNIPNNEVDAFKKDMGIQ